MHPDPVAASRRPHSSPFSTLAGSPYDLIPLESPSTCSLERRVTQRPPSSFSFRSLVHRISRMATPSRISKPSRPSRGNSMPSPHRVRWPRPVTPPLSSLQQKSITKTSHKSHLYRYKEGRRSETIRDAYEAIHADWRNAASLLKEDQRNCLIGAVCLGIVDPVPDLPHRSMSGSIPSRRRASIQLVGRSEEIGRDKQQPSPFIHRKGTASTQRPGTCPSTERLRQGWLHTSVPLHSFSTPLTPRKMLDRPRPKAPKRSMSRVPSLYYSAESSDDSSKGEVSMQAGWPVSSDRRTAMQPIPPLSSHISTPPPPLYPQRRSPSAAPIPYRYFESPFDLVTDWSNNSLAQRKSWVMVSPPVLDDDYDEPEDH